MKLNTFWLLVEPVTMNSQTFSREYLQNIPEQRKQQLVDSIVQGFIHQLQNSAAEGKTSYLYEMSMGKGSFAYSNPTRPVITDDELVQRFQKKFPDCKVTYEEVWVDSGRDTKTLKKGIQIDWS